MINFIQSNQNLQPELLNIIDNDIWNELLNKLVKREKIDLINNYIHSISINYNIDKKNIIKDFLNYIIKYYPKYINSKFLDFIENLMHSQNQNNNIHINYSISRLSSFLST